MTGLRTSSRATRTVRARVLLVVAGAALLAACGGAPDQDVAVPPAAVPAEAPSRAPADDPAAAPDGPPQLSAATATLRETLVGSTPVRYDATTVSGPTLDGQQFDAAAVEGPVVYWFWAPWCTVCRAEAPTVADVAERWDGEVTFVGVASRGPQDDMDAFVTETGTEGIRHIADLDGTIWARFGVSAQPAFVFVDREGSATGWLGGLGEPLLDEVAASLAG